MTLQEYFNANPKGALALSGGVDSAYLLHCAQAAGAQVQPYFAETQFQPAFERRDATQLCGGLGLPAEGFGAGCLGGRPGAAQPARSAAITVNGKFSLPLPPLRRRTATACFGTGRTPRML